MQKNIKALGIGFLLLLIGTVSFLYWAGKKQVWFLDEIYTYESANGFEQAWPTTSLDEWMTGRDIEAFLAADSDRLSLNEITVRLYSDHVPLYFWLFRAASLFFFHGSGSIWIGLSINLAFYLIILALAFRMFLHLTGRPLVSAVVIFLTLITNRLMLEQITMLRMYVMLLLAELLLLLAGLWILRDADSGKMKPGVFLFLFAVSVTGLLTHYDFWIFYAATAAIFCIWLLISAFRREKRIWVTRKFRYVLAWVGNFGCSLLATIWLFPYCRWNLNRGKGKIALESVFDFSPEKIGNILWGYRSLAASVFGEKCPVIAALTVMFGCLAGGAVILYKKREIRKLMGVILLVLVAQAYQFAVCFTLPNAQEERYLWGSSTVMMLCMAWGGVLILQEIFRKLQSRNVHSMVFYAASFILTAGILAGELSIIDGGYGIAYLFQPDKDISVLKEHSEIPWIVYDPTLGIYSYYDWLIPEQICFLSQDNTAEDAEALCGLEGRENFVLYIYEDYLPDALSFFEDTLDRDYSVRYLTKSTNLTVFLVEME